MLSISKVRVSFREADGVRFPYVDIGCEDHGRPSFRLWVSSRLVKDVKDSSGNVRYILQFPVENAEIIRTEKGSIVLRPASCKITYNILVPCGYRGSSRLQVLTPADAVLYEYMYYESPRGNLGVSHGALVVAPMTEPLRIRWKRSGRLYGAPDEGITILYPDGREETLDDLPDGIDELNRLKELII